MYELYILANENLQPKIIIAYENSDYLCIIGCEMKLGYNQQIYIVSIKIVPKIKFNINRVLQYTFSVQGKLSNVLHLLSR